MSTIDLDLNTICAQRKLLLKFTVPPIRFNTVSPYVEFPQYQQRDFDMRRKAEILQYNRSNTKTNKPTKNQQWAILNTTTAPQSRSYADKILYDIDEFGNYKQVVVKYPDTYEVVKEEVSTDSMGNPIYSITNVIIPGTLPQPCSETNIPIPTSSSGVPGPIMNLSYDPAVPLYNYVTNNRSYAIINPTNTKTWDTFTTTDISFNDSIETRLCYVIINNIIPRAAYTFTIQTPISLFFTGTLRDNVTPSSISLINNTVRLQSAAIHVYYNSQQVVFDATENQSVIFSPMSNFETIGFDIALTTPFSGGQISGQIYLGMITVSNVHLLTQPGYIYDIQLSFIMSSSLNAFYSSYFSSFNSGIIANASNTTTKQSGCTIKNRFYSPRSGFNFDGV
jgi:hypothetical protein